MSFDIPTLETHWEWEKLQEQEANNKILEISDIQKHIDKISQNQDPEIRERLKNSKLQDEVLQFISDAANNKLNEHSSEYTAWKFDTDGEAWLDSFEFTNFTESLSWAIEQIVLLDGIWAFSDIQEDSNYSWWLAPDKKVARHFNSLSITESSIAENVLNSLWISDWELHEMSEKQFDITSPDSWGEMWILLAKEIWEGIEDLIRLVLNIPSAAILLPRYLWYRVDMNSNDPIQATEWNIKNTELVRDNPALGMLDLVGEKWIEMIKELGKMLIGWKQWDIATKIAMIPAMLAWWAGIAKVWAKANKMQKVENIVSNVQNWAKRVDDIVWSWWVWHMTGSFSESAPANSNIAPWEVEVAEIWDISWIEESITQTQDSIWVKAPSEDIIPANWNQEVVELQATWTDGVSLWWNTGWDTIWTSMSWVTMRSWNNAYSDTNTPWVTHHSPNIVDSWSRNAWANIYWWGNTSSSIPERPHLRVVENHDIPQLRNFRNWELSLWSEVYISWIDAQPVSAQITGWNESHYFVKLDDGREFILEPWSLQVRAHSHIDSTDSSDIWDIQSEKLPPLSSQQVSNIFTHISDQPVYRELNTHILNGDISSWAGRQELKATLLWTLKRDVDIFWQRIQGNTSWLDNNKPILWQLDLSIQEQQASLQALREQQATYIRRKRDLQYQIEQRKDTMSDVQRGALKDLEKSWDSLSHNIDEVRAFTRLQELGWFEKWGHIPSELQHAKQELNRAQIQEIAQWNIKTPEQRARDSYASMYRSKLEAARDVISWDIDHYIHISINHFPGKEIGDLDLSELQELSQVTLKSYRIISGQHYQIFENLNHKNQVL